MNFCKWVAWCHPVQISLGLLILRREMRVKGSILVGMCLGAFVELGYLKAPYCACRVGTDLVTAARDH